MKNSVCFYSKFLTRVSKFPISPFCHTAVSPQEARKKSCRKLNSKFTFWNNCWHFSANSRADNIWHSSVLTFCLKVVCSGWAARQLDLLSKTGVFSTIQEGYTKFNRLLKDCYPITKKSDTIVHENKFAHYLPEQSIQIFIIAVFLLPMEYSGRESLPIYTDFCITVFSWTVFVVFYSSLLITF